MTDGASQHMTNWAIIERVADADAEQGKVLDALRKYDQIMRAGAATADVWRKAGEALLRVKEFAQAISVFRQALRLGDDSPATHHNLGRALFTMGDADSAIRHLRASADRTTQMDPLEALANMMPNAPSASHQDVLDARRSWANRLALNSQRPQPWQRGDLSRRRIRVAYISAHFSQRNYMKPVWALINHHDRKQFQIHLLRDNKAGDDLLGYRPDTTDQIHDVSNLDDNQLAALLKKNQIDILIDLSAYSHAQRLSFFSSKIAPITSAWFNMFATSGLAGFDYIVGDQHVVKPEEEEYYAEQVARLPLSYLTFQVDYPTPEVAPLPCLTTGAFTFGSLISQYKITPPVLDAWAEILNRSVDSRLLLSNTTLKSPHNQSYVLDEFTRRGVANNRIGFLPPADHDTFLSYYDRIDLALDAFPYNGGTTTMEALWQGVPVLTKRGDRWAARTSETLLFECEMADYVAEDSEDYVERAVKHAERRDRWAEFAEQRKSMRSALRRSSACDGARLALEMEKLFHHWTR